MPLFTNTYGPSYVPLRLVEPSAPRGTGLGLAEPSDQPATGQGSQQPWETQAPHSHGAEPPDPCGVQRGSPHPCGALVPRNPEGKALGPRGQEAHGSAGPRRARETRRGAHPSPGTSRSLRPSARSCPARPPPPELGPAAGPAGGCRGRRTFLAPAAGRALAPCLRDIPAGRPLRLRRRRAHVTAERHHREERGAARASALSPPPPSGGFLQVEEEEEEGGRVEEGGRPGREAEAFRAQRSYQRKDGAATCGCRPLRSFSPLVMNQHESLQPVRPYSAPNPKGTEMEIKKEGKRLTTHEVAPREHG